MNCLAVGLDFDVLWSLALQYVLAELICNCKNKTELDTGPIKVSMKMAFFSFKKNLVWNLQFWKPGKVKYLFGSMRGSCNIWSVEIGIEYWNFHWILSLSAKKNCNKILHFGAPSSYLLRCLNSRDKASKLNKIVFF